MDGANVLRNVLFLFLIFGLCFGAVYKITISNPNNYDLTDYQVKIDLSNYGVSQYLKVCSDIFCSSILNFCYEQSNGECNTNPSNIIWVKVPHIPAGVSTNIYVFDGETTNYAKNGDEVFDFYDDFSTDTGWYTSEASYSITTYDGYTVMSIYPTNTSANNIVYKEGFSLTSKFAVKIRAIEPSYAANDQFGLTVWGGIIDNTYHRPNQGYLSFLHESPSVGFRLVRTDTPDHYYIAISHPSTTYTIWHTIELRVLDDKLIAILDDTYSISGNDTTYRYFDKVGLWVDNEDTALPTYYDYIIVRKFADQEPTISIIKISNLSIHIIQPKDGNTIYSSKYTIYWEVRAESGSSNYITRLYINGNLVYESPTTSISEGETHPYSYEYDGFTTEGDYNVYVEAYDLSSTATIYDQVIVSVSFSTIIEPANTYYNMLFGEASIPVKLKIYPFSSSDIRIKILKNGNLIKDEIIYCDDINNCEYSTYISENKEGTYTYTFEVDLDNDGDIDSVKSKTMTIPSHIWRLKDGISADYCKYINNRIECYKTNISGRNIYVERYDWNTGQWISYKSCNNWPSPGGIYIGMYKNYIVGVMYTGDNIIKFFKINYENCSYVESAECYWGNYYCDIWAYDLFNRAIINGKVIVYGDSYCDNDYDRFSAFVYDIENNSVSKYSTPDLIYGAHIYPLGTRNYYIIYPDGNSVLFSMSDYTDRCYGSHTLYTQWYRGFAIVTSNGKVALTSITYNVYLGNYSCYSGYTHLYLNDDSSNYYITVCLNNDSAGITVCRKITISKQTMDIYISGYIYSSPSSYKIHLSNFDYGYNVIIYPDDIFNNEKLRFSNNSDKLYGISTYLYGKEKAFLVRYNPYFGPNKEYVPFNLYLVAPITNNIVNFKLIGATNVYIPIEVRGISYVDVNINPSATGEYELYVGNFKISDVNVVYDSAPPIINIKRESFNKFKNNSNLSVNIFISDDISPSIDCNIYYDGSLKDSNIFFNPSDNNYIFDLNFGVHSIKVICKDLANNVAEKEVDTGYIRIIKAIGRTFIALSPYFANPLQYNTGDGNNAWMYLITEDVPLVGLQTSYGIPGSSDTLDLYYILDDINYFETTEPDMSTLYYQLRFVIDDLFGCTADTCYIQIDNINYEETYYHQGQFLTNNVLDFWVPAGCYTYRTYVNTDGEWRSQTSGVICLSNYTQKEITLVGNSYVYFKDNNIKLTAFNWDENGYIYMLIEGTSKDELYLKVYCADTELINTPISGNIYLEYNKIFQCNKSSLQVVVMDKYGTYYLNQTFFNPNALSLKNLREKLGELPFAVLIAVLVAIVYLSGNWVDIYGRLIGYALIIFILWQGGDIFSLAMLVVGIGVLIDVMGHIVPKRRIAAS